MTMTTVKYLYRFMLDHMYYIVVVFLMDHFLWKNTLVEIFSHTDYFSHANYRVKNILMIF